MSRKKPVDITKEELDKLRICADFLFFDQYKDMASFPRFEECVGSLIPDDVYLEKIFQEIVGPKRKYITFRRLIKSYLEYKKGNLSEETQQFFSYVLNEILHKEGESVGKKIEGATKYSTKEGMKKYAISKFSVITNETKDKISGFQIYYDDFFKNDLFLSKDQDEFYVSLEINLPILDSAEINKFPDANYRDGITHIFGTVEDKITLLGFKCRSGKTSFIGKPIGQPFLFGVVKKQLQSIKIEVLNGEITYLEPKFMEVQRVNPFIDKEKNEITKKFLEEDKPIYEEDLLDDIEDEEEIDKHVLQPLIDDDFFFDPRFKDEIEGEKYKDVKPLRSRFWHKDLNKGKKKGNFNFKVKDLVKEADQTANEKKEATLRGKRRYNGRMKKLKDDGLNLDKDSNLYSKLTEKDPKDILLNKNNFNNLMTQLGNKIGKEFLKLKEEKEKEKENDNKDEKDDKELLRGRGKKKKKSPTKDGKTTKTTTTTKDGKTTTTTTTKSKDATTTTTTTTYVNGGSGKKRKEKKKYDFDDGYGFYDDEDLEKYFNDVYNEYNDMWNRDSGFGFFDWDFPSFPEKKEEKKMTKEEIKELKKEAQEKWKNLIKKYNKHSPYLILQEIGAVVKALSYLKAEEKGDTSKYSMDEKVRMYEILNDNSNIIALLSKAHEESLRREAELKKIEEEKERLIQLEEEEKKRKEEEKKRLEEEIKRRELEKKISEEKYIMEQNEKKRLEEEKRIKEEIEKENDRRKKRELEKEEKRKKEEAERQRKEEEKKKKELEEQQRKIEEIKRKENEKKKKKKEKDKKKKHKKRKNYKN